MVVRSKRRWSDMKLLLLFFVFVHLPVSVNGNDLLDSLEKFDNLFREQLDKIKNINIGNKPPLIHVLGDFNFRDIAWSDRLNKSGSTLSHSGGSDFDRYHEWPWIGTIIQFPYQRKKYFGLNFDLSSWSVCRHSFPGQAQWSWHCFWHIENCYPPVKKSRRKVYRYQKGDYESIRNVL